MAKKIRFPLKMNDGIEVRDLEGLKEHFSLEQVLFYLEDGRLETWLRDHYEDELADEVVALDKQDTQFNRKLCEVFGVEYAADEEVDLEGMRERKRKQERLNEVAGGENYFDVVDQIAFEQDDLYDLLDEGETEIYLCGERFSIPLGKKGIRYIGINSPTVVISAKEKVNFEEKGISLENVRFDEKYQKLLDELELQMENPQKERRTSSSGYGRYCSDSYINFMLTPKDKKEAETCYERVSVLMEGVEYDRDADIRELRGKLLDSGIAGIAKEYLQNL